MSLELYPRRLFWDGRCGAAKWDGIERRLAARPEIGMPAAEVDFAPGVVAMIRPQTWDKARDMEPAEVAASLAYLLALV